MALLEKQKLLKMSKLTVAATKLKPSSSITVSITNDLYNHQPKSDEQIVQLNGIDAISSTEKKTVAGPTVDSVAPKTSVEVTRMSTETVVTDSGMNKNNLKPNASLPEICVQPKEAMKKNSTTTDKSNNNIQSFSALSDNDKNKLLQKTESEYMMHR